MSYMLSQIPQLAWIYTPVGTVGRRYTPDFVHTQSRMVATRICALATVLSHWRSDCVTCFCLQFISFPAAFASQGNDKGVFGVANSQSINGEWWFV